MLSFRCPPPLWRAALFAASLVWFAASQQPGRGADPGATTPPDNVEQFRLFLRDDVGRLSKLSNLAKEVTKEKDKADKENNESKKAFYTNLEAKLLEQVGRDPMTPGALTLAINKRFDELEGRLVHLGELAAVLRLSEWSVFDIADGVLQADRFLPEGSPKKRTTGMFKTLSDNFLTGVRAVAKGDRRQKIALCVLLGEEANKARKRKKAGYNYRAVLMEAVPIIADFSKAKGPEERPLREAAATALSVLDAQPDQLIDAVKEVRTEDGKDVNSRRIAFAAVRRPFEMVSPRNDPYFQSTGSESPEERTGKLNKTDDRIKREMRVLVELLGPKAVPQLAQGLDHNLESAPDIRLTCAEGFKDLMAMLLDTNRVPLAPGRMTKYVPDYENLALTHRSITNLTPLFEALRDNLPRLVDACADPDPNIRAEALSVLRDLVEVRNRVRAWQAEFQRYSKEAPKGARALQPPPDAQDLSKPLPDPFQKGTGRGVSVLAAALKHPDPEVRLAALDVLEELGPDAAAPALPDLIQALGDKDKFVSWSAVRILGRFPTEHAKDVVPALVPLVGTPDGDYAKALCALLSKYGADAAPAVPALTKAILFGEPDARIAYLQTLPAIGTAGADAVPAIRQILRPDPKGARIAPSKYPPAFAPGGPPTYDDPGVRAAAAEALGKFGKLAASAEPELRAALNDDDSNVRRAAGDALLRIRGK
jgi:HEAT repeat protein